MKISITYKIPEIGVNLLKERHEVWMNEEERALTKEELKKLASESDGMLTMLSDKIDKEVISAGKNKLKVIANYAVGYNNIDFNYAKELGIEVTNTPDVLTETTADLAWALMMAVSRRIVESDKFVREGKFKGWKPELFLGNDIYGKTLGVIGFGRIGQAFARRAKGFDMKVFYYKRNRLSLEKEKELGVEYLELKELLKVSDFVSLHTPLTEDTYHLLNEERLNLMKKTAYLINTARGPVVDEKYLYEMLKEKKIAGAGLDVYENEPKLTSGLETLENVVLAPHIGSGTIETRNNMSEMAAKGIIKSLNGEKPFNSVFK